jgi:hypothetical protein
MNDKIHKAIELIERAIAHARNPCVATSFGKDSMALLHLLRSMGLHLPCVFWREPFHPWKYRFANKVIEDWGLVVYDWRPTETAVQQNGDEFEIQNYYSIGDFSATCPTGIVPFEEDKPWLCAFYDLYRKPLQGRFDAPWDMMFLGHKGCDSDPIMSGCVGTRVEFRINPGGIDAAYPLRDWTHEDVFRYCEENSVPLQEDRYAKRDGAWGELEDKTTNPDYFHCCTRCLDSRPEAPKFVDCPKLGMKIENISSRVRWTDAKPLSYMED